MKKLCIRQREVVSVLVLLLVAFLVSACSSGNVAPSTAVGVEPGPAATVAPLTTSDDEAAALAGVPAEARVATRRGDPRPPSYWALWNSCAPENRSATVAANGGRAARWFIMDDFIADPGIQLGDYPVTNCAEGLQLLQAATGTSGDLDDLAGRLFAAELNLNAGAETCPIAEETVVATHLILAAARFNGSGKYDGSISEEIANAIPRVRELLATYNSGELCR